MRSRGIPRGALALSHLLGKLERPARLRRAAEGHRRPAAAGERRPLQRRAGQSAPRARMDGVAERQAAARQEAHSRRHQPRHQHRRASRTGGAAAGAARQDRRPRERAWAAPIAASRRARSRSACTRRIMWAKLRSLSEGARIATAELWGKRSAAPDSREDAIMSRLIGQDHCIRCSPPNLTGCRSRRRHRCADAGHDRARMDQHAVVGAARQRLDDEKQSRSRAFTARSKCRRRMHSKDGVPGGPVPHPEPQHLRRLQPRRARPDPAASTTSAAPTATATSSGTPTARSGRSPPPGRCCMPASSRRTAPTREFADTRAAYDALPEATKAQARRADRRALDLALARASSAATRRPRSEIKARPPARHPVVRRHPGSGRNALYIASHASHIIGWPVEEGRALLDELLASRDAAALRLPAQMAARRSGDLGQPLHPAPRDAVRVEHPRPRHAPQHRDRRARGGDGVVTATGES